MLNSSFARLCGDSKRKGTNSIETAYKRSLSAVGILHGVMTVIPGTSVLHNWECICEMIVGCDWTLGDAVDAVKLHGIQLSQSVPMNARPVGIDTCVWQLVVDCDVKYLRSC